MATIQERLAKMRQDTTGQQNTASVSAGNDISRRLDAMRLDLQRNSTANVAPTQQTVTTPRTTASSPDFMSEYAREMARQAVEQEKRAGVSKVSPGTPGGGGRGTPERGVSGIPTSLYADAFTPDPGLYLTEEGRKIAGEMQSQADKAYSGKSVYEHAQEAANAELEAQRKKANEAMRTANAFLPLEAAPASAYDDYFRLYDEAADEEAKLHEMGGRSARELPLTIGKSFGAGVVGATRGLINEAGYLDQRISQLTGQTLAQAQMDENAEMWRRNGREDYAQEMEAARDAFQPTDELETWADFGQDYIENAAMETAGYGKVGKALSNVSQGVGGMVPSIISNLVVPGSGLWVMFTQASGNATEEALQNGASKDKALLYGAAVGGIEVLTEKMFGGIPGLGVGALDEGIESFVKSQIGSEAAQRAVLFFIDALGEGVEEFTSEFGDWLMDKWLVGADQRSFAEVNHDALYAAMIGSMTSIAMQAPANLFKSSDGRKQIARQLADQVGEQISGNTGTSAIAQYADGEVAAGRMSETGADTLRRFYDGAQDPVSYMQDMTAAYNAGASGAALSTVSSTTLNEAQKQAAYLAGQAAQTQVQTADTSAAEKPLQGERKAPAQAIQPELSVETAENVKPTEAAPRYTFDLAQNPEGQYAVIVHDAQGEDSLQGPFASREDAISALNDFKAMTEGVAANVKAGSGENAVQEAKANGEGTDLLSRSGERNDGTRAAEQAGELEETAGRDPGGNESWQTAEAKPADGGAADLDVGEKISTASLGLPDGSTTDAIYEVTGGDTEYTRKARQIAAERGLNLHLFKGDNLHFNSSGDARGYIIGNDVYVRADHPLYTAEQLVRHEIGHDMIARGEIDPNTVRERVAKLYGESGAQSVAELYASAYDGMTVDEAWTEIICDSLGNMNIFSGNMESVAQPYQRVLNDVKVSTENSQTQQQRAPPSTEGEASREDTVTREYVDYSNDAEKEARIENALSEVVRAGKTVKLTADEIGTEKGATDWTATKKARTYVKNILTKVLGDNSVFFEMPNGTLEAYITKTGKNHYAALVSPETAAMARRIQEIIGNARYAFSSKHDIHTDAGERVAAKDWDYFVAGVNVGNTTIPMLFSLRTIENDPRTQIYGVRIGLEMLDTDNKTEANTSHENDHQGEPDARASNYEGFSASVEDNVSQEDASVKDGQSSRETSMTDLQRQNDALRARVEYWRNETKLTKTPTAREADVRRAARDVVKKYRTTADASGITETLKGAADYAVQHRGDENLYTALKEHVLPAAQEIVQNATELHKDESYDEIKAALKKPLVISAQDAHDVSPEWGAWRNANVGKVNVSVNGQGTPVDTVYTELSERFPGLFPTEITHPADQLQRMVEVMSDLAPVYENPYSYNMAEAIEYCANDLVDRILGDDVRESPPTRADKLASRLKEQYAKRTAEAIERERAKRDRQITAIKDHYAEVKQAARDRKSDSAARDKLLRIAKRLQNKKLPSVNRALLDQYIGDLDTVAKSITGKSVEKLTALRDWYDDQVANNPDFISDPSTEEKIKRLSKTQISDLTSAQVIELTEVLLNIENELRTQKKLIDSEDRRDTYLQGVQTIEDVDATRGSKKGPVDKLIVTETLSPLRMIRRIIGYNDSDPLFQRTKELADGQRRMFDYQRRASERFQRFMDDKAFIEKLAGKKAQWIDISGIGADGKPVTVQITPAMRMSIYLHSLNDQNLKHIRDGGITVPDQKLYIKGDMAEAYTNGTTIKLTPSAVRSIAAGMTAQERAFAQAAHDYFNGMSQSEINAVSEKLKGYSVAGVEHYFPINTDTAFTKSDFESLKFDGTLEGMGFLKERVNAANPIMLRDMNDVLTKSISQHAKYVGLAIPVRNFNKVWGVTKSSFNEDGSRNAFESSVQKAVGRKWGKSAVDYVEKMMTDLQTSGGKTDAWDKVMNNIRSNYAQAVLTLNLSVAMKQAASYPTAAAVIGWKPLARALADVGKVDLDLIAKYTPLQWYRSQGFSSQELGDMTKRGMKLPPALNWVQGVDLLTTRKLWKAAEYYVRQNSKVLNVGSDAYYNAVADIYNQIIEETQPNYTTMQRPQLLRSDSTLLQNLAMFKTQPFQNVNILFDAFGNLEAKRAAYQNSSSEETKAAYQQAQKRAAWAVSSQIVSLAVFAAMTAAWAGIRGKDDKYRDDDGNLTLGSTASALGKDMLSSAFGMVPFGSDVYEMAASLSFGDKYYGMDAVTPSAIADFAKSIVNGANTVGKMIEAAGGEDKAVDWNELRLKMVPVINNASKVFGVPVENVTNLFNAAYRQAARKSAGQYAGEYAYLRLTTSSESNSAAYYDNLYRAYTNDKDAFELIVNDMIASGDFSEKNIKNAMETRMKKAQGVDSVKDLEQRYMSPSQQMRYDAIFDPVSISEMWTGATEEQRDRLTDKLYSVATETDAGTKIQGKIDGGSDVGLTDVEYMLYLLALDMADQENRGSYTNAEVETAIKNVPGLTNKERSYLWNAQGRNAKTDPWAK